MDLKCQLVTRMNKEGKPYEVIVIKLTDNYEKLVFLDSQDKEIMRLASLVDSNVNKVENPFNQ